MKKMTNKGISIIIVALILSGFTMTANAGDGDSKGGFGVKGGINFSTIGLDNQTAEEHRNRFRIGGIAGISYEVATDGFFAFEAGLLYDLRGTKEQSDFIGGQELVLKNYLHYVSLPINLKFYIGDNFNVHLGPYASVLMGGKARLERRDSDGDILESDEYRITGEKAQDAQGDDYLKRYDAGLQAGVEFISNSGIGVGTRFSKGLIDITNDDHFLGAKNATTTEFNVYAIFRF